MLNTSNSRSFDNTLFSSQHLCTVITGIVTFTYFDSDCSAHTSINTHSLGLCVRVGFLLYFSLIRFEVNEIRC